MALLPDVRWWLCPPTGPLFDFGAMPADGVGRSPSKIRNTLPVGHSRHLTSVGTAVALESFCSNKRQEVANLYYREHRGSSKCHTCWKSEIFKPTFPLAPDSCVQLMV